MSPIEVGPRDQMEAHAAHRIALALQRAVSERGRASLALPGGRSVGGVLRSLARIDLPWSQVTVLPADERALPEDDPERNWHIIQEELLAPLTVKGVLPPHNIHPFTFLPDRADMGLEAFVETLALPVNDRGVVLLDVVVLGAGEDGHVASLFPRSEQVNSDSAGFLTVENSPKPPPRRITISPSMILASGTAVLLFFGEGKANALSRFSDASTTVVDCPARIVLSARDHAIYADIEAATAP